MVKIAIVEDENAASDQIVSYCGRYAKENAREISVMQYQSTEQLFAGEYTAYDMILMDIELPGLDGFSAVKKLRAANNDVAVIFVTNLAQYAVKGYEVGAFDFIVKPVSYYNFALKMNRVLSYLDTLVKKKLIISTRDGKKIVPVDELRYVEVMKHVVVFHLGNSQIVASGTLKKVREELEGLPFAFCDACYLVNMSYVTEIKGNQVLVDGNKLQISSPKRREFTMELTAYLALGGGRKL